MSKDLRKEQAVLLRFEKQIAGLATTLAALGVAASAADDKLGAARAGEAYAELEAALKCLTEATGSAHEALNAMAVQAGARLLVTGGLPKDEIPPPEEEPPEADREIESGIRFGFW